jgi:hypothetical protein
MLTQLQQTQQLRSGAPYRNGRCKDTVHAIKAVHLSYMYLHYCRCSLRAAAEAKMDCACKQITSPLKASATAVAAAAVATLAVAD